LADTIYSTRNKRKEKQRPKSLLRQTLIFFAARKSK